ncbi:Smr/MutS family protein [Carboxylicivirga sediminis]|uniref:Endonuclease MutS2 n=1 Tax=Carboxylicivirga sediminis TaxID=2006564 RepID=A0A941F4Z6_9BACT|nr:Smr/MutS family protein [Carboxylicivirga sediminis]MBR8536033.1 Smr/MutS family protein [Carboxylicivirga sediminis]
MIYPESFEDKIKFTRVRELVKESCMSGLGKEAVDEMSFSTHFDEVSLNLQRTNEFKKVCLEEDNFPTGYFIDVREPLARIRTEGRFMDESELFDLKRSLTTINEICRFFNKKDDEDYPKLKELVAEVAVFPFILDNIDGILNKFGKIKDNASPELARIRREIFNKQNSISRKLSSILKRAKQDGLVDADVTVSIRDGRAVIPVPAANKRKLGGIVQDESATGKTSFIEPAEVVEINNEVRELQYAERREMTRILIEMADVIRPYIDELLESYRFMGTIDFIRAKARFAISINGLLPDYKKQQNFIWKEAVHPLLHLQHKPLNKPVVPLDIELSDPKQRLLLISGPNAGGKSVCLQTVGLLQYMFQCGLLVPMDEGSTMGIFKHIFMDMGDEQSIENDLSTYSSHLFNMKHFLRYSQQQTLILIDEFGTGTEPMLGGAIAESVLEQLNQQKVYGVITTHYTNLKHMASQTEGIENGAMLFDTGRIMPLYKLQIAQPGSSFAFEIARKIGLPENILTSAKEKIGQEHVDYDKNLREIVRDKRYWEQKRNTIRINEKKLADVLERYQLDLQNVKKERKEILDKAKAEAEFLLSKANKEIENTIRTIKETQADKEKTKLARQQLEDFKETAVDKKLKDEQIERKIRQIEEREKRKANRKSNKPDEAAAAAKLRPKASEAPLQVGDNVKLKGQNTPGEILKIQGKEATVAFGSLSTTVKINRLERVSNKAVKRANITNPNASISNVGDKVRERKLTFKPDIDVRGKRTEEAIQLVLNHLDEAVICEASEVKILHGKGNGILRLMIREQLNTLPFVSSFRDEHVQYGGSGITIVEIG